MAGAPKGTSKVRRRALSVRPHQANWCWKLFRSSLVTGPYADRQKCKEFSRVEPKFSDSLLDPSLVCMLFLCDASTVGLFLACGGIYEAALWRAQTMPAASEIESTSGLLGFSFAGLRS